MLSFPHGRIATHKTDDPSLDPYQDYFPGQVLLALAVACEQNASTIDEERLRRSFQYYRHRFRYKRNFGQVTWLLQAFSKWWQVTGEQHFADMTFEIADWLLGYQQDKTGGFINDHQPGTPGYTTAVYLEGLASAMSITDGARRETYFDSCARGFRFLDQLIIQDRDRAILPNRTMRLAACASQFTTARYAPTSSTLLSAMLEFSRTSNIEVQGISGSGQVPGSDSDRVSYSNCSMGHDLVAIAPDQKY